MYFLTLVVGWGEEERDEGVERRGKEWKGREGKERKEKGITETKEC